MIIMNDDQVNVDSREAELSWLGSWLVYFLVATVEIIISAANTTFNQVRILRANRNIKLVFSDSLPLLQQS